MEDELRKLRQAIAEQQRLHEEKLEEVQRLREEEREEQQRRREEVQRRREEVQRQFEEECEEEQRLLEEECEEQQRRLEEVQRRREEVQRQFEEEQRQFEEEREEVQRRLEKMQRRREEAENVIKPLSLHGYLNASHSLSLAIKAITDRRLSTQGDTTKPAGRVYPRRIVPWDEFPAQQEKIWALLADESFDAQRFPSQHQMDYVRSVISPVSSEPGLRYFERGTVDNAVQKLVGAVYDSLVLRDRLRLRGPVTFESHTDPDLPSDSLSEHIECMSVTGPSAGEAASAPTTTGRMPRRVKTAKGTADQLCIRRTSDGADIPVLAIEYKAPHKLRLEEIATGLTGEIQPARDIINQSGEDFVFAAKWLTAAVVTQLFSYMVGKGIQYGYVCTGQAFIFLHIPDDPTIVLYHVCVPNADVMEDDENRLHRTAVAQVFAFILQSLRVSPPALAWHDAAANLDAWDVEYDDVLRRIPEIVRKEKKNHTPYKAQRWKGFARSPIRTRAYCKPISASQHRDESDDDDQKGNTTLASIQERPYCTQACLYGLARGGPIDSRCPNAAKHGPEHIGQTQFLHLLRDQLARDRGPDADSVPLYLRGSVGALFKVRLSAFGYTLVAKGVMTKNLPFLQGEQKVYDELGAIQGQHIPVCLGLIDLILPHYCDGGVYRHFLLLSWAGQPLSRCFGQVDKAVAISAITAAYEQLHRLRVLHNDAHPRNILFDAVGGRLMVTDFERSTIGGRPALGPISPNSQRMRKRMSVLKRGKDDFAKELKSAVSHASALFTG